MAKTSVKRVRSKQDHVSRKRQRTDQASEPRPEGKAVAVDDLAWKPVTLPDQLEDAEGFFGLEEIDNVEIVKENGEVRYKVSVPEPDWEGFDEKDTLAITPEHTAKKSTKRKKNEKSKQPNVTTSFTNGFAALQDDLEEDTDISAWLPLGLSSNILAAIAKLKFAKPTPIQAAAIPEILSGQDVIGKASTGSGKTLAFGLPIIESILSRQDLSAESRTPTALILSPTRELAHQISQHIINVCTNLAIDSPRVATITGGLSIHKQERLLAKADIVIGTPGRLWEVMSTIPGSLTRLKKIKFLVADEADRLLSEGHFKEVEDILTALDKKEIEGEDIGKDDMPTRKQRQTLVFSATFQKDLQRKLAGRTKSSNNILDNKQSLDYLMQKLNFRTEPKFIDVNPIRQMASKLREGILECGSMEKDLYLYTLLLLYPECRTLVFTNSISSVRRLVQLLQELSLKVLALHSEMPQKARLRSTERFTDASNASGILIATDIAARGLDIPDVDLIIHYHVPRAADTYVHRSGRTARAEAEGMSIMLCSPEEILPVERLVTKVHASSSKQDKQHSLHTLSPDTTLIARLKPRITIASTIISASSAKAKINSEDSWLRKAADELGVDYDSDSFAEAEKTAKGRGRGGGRKQKTKSEAGISKQQLSIWRAELQDLLNKRVNAGVSEKYLTAGGVDVNKLLVEQQNGRAGGQFLGHTEALREWN